MAEELDTSWFDLKNYEAFKTMSILKWADALERRASLYDVYNAACMAKDDSVKRDQLELLCGLSEVSLLKTNPTKTSIDYDPDHFYSSSVNCITRRVVWDLARDYGFVSVPDNSLYKKIPLRHSGMCRGGNNAVATINLSATDEQIKNDFNHWLINYRKQVGLVNRLDKGKSKKKEKEDVIKAPESKLIAQDDFDYWVKFGVIPYLDLMLIAKMEGKRITQNQLASLIFPNDYDVGTTDRLRDTTKPMAERLINQKTHKTLLAQLTTKKVG